MSRVGPVPCPILVGRDDLLELADRRIVEAAGGRGQLLLLSGQAGTPTNPLWTSMNRAIAHPRWRSATPNLGLTMASRAGPRIGHPADEPSKM